MKRRDSQINKHETINPIYPHKVIQSFIAVASWVLGRMSFSILILGAIWFLTQSCAAAPGVWEYTGNLNSKRAGHEAVFLLDGRVLLTRGDIKIQ